MSKRNTTIFVHIICCLIFILLPVVFSPASIRETMRVPWYFMLSNLVLIFFFYCNVYFLIPNLLFRQRHFLYFGSVVLCMLFVMAVPDMIRPFVAPFSETFARRDFPRPPGNAPVFFRRLPGLLSFCLVWVLGIMYTAIERWRQAEKKSKEIELEKVNAELSYLKLQVNPHFLFNTLNNIYSLATISSPQTPVAVMKLSDIMRYVTQDAQADFVTLEQEINYVHNYIELQKLRSDTLDLEFETSGNFVERRIAPLLLISFVENAFKHGISSHQKSKIVIRVQEKDAVLNLLVQNAIFERSDWSTGTNIGMANTRRRLELLYPGKFSLKVENQNNLFSLTLTIDLKDD